MHRTRYSLLCIMNTFLRKEQSTHPHFSMRSKEDVYSAFYFWRKLRSLDEGSLRDVPKR